MSELIANWNFPTQIVAGASRIGELAIHCRERSLSKPLIVTDSGLAALQMFEELCCVLKEADLDYEVFSNIQANPNQGCVSRGVEAYRSGKHDSVIAVGGGSALDAGKAIALMVGQELPIWDFEDVGDNYLRVNEQGMAPVIAVPTTAGTGSEVGRASVITDSKKRVKKIIFHPKMLPELVILDPVLTLGLPPHITAATGIDALSHCLEALCSPFYHPMAEGIAIEGIRLIKEFLPRAYVEGQDIEARMQMLVASSMGATAFQKGLGAMHAIAHSLGAVYGTHHGLLNAVLMPYVLIANKSEVEGKLTRLARYLDLPDASYQGFVQWVLTLRQELAIPNTLKDLNIPSDDLNNIAQMSIQDPSAGGNPIPFSLAEYQSLIGRAYAGDLGEFNA